MRHYSDKDKSVWAYLQSIGVKFESVYHGGRVDNDNGHKWEHDLFTVRFVRGKSEIETSYRQGIGHRGSANLNGLGAEAEQAGAGAPKYLETAYKGAKVVKTYVKKPSAASVLYCLLSDASLGAELFADFCADLGYDEDSRKALAIYEECQKTAAQLRMFTGDERAKLNELLEDY
jgi:hypothetical protein